MEEITSLIITYTGNNVWTFTDNTMPPGSDRGNDAYSGTWNIDRYTFKSKTGGILYNNIYIGNIQYVDEVTPANSFNPTSCRQLHTYLKQVDFFEEGNSGSGSTDIALTDLTDAGFSNKFGRGGQVLIIDENELTFNTRAVIFVESIEDLDNVPNIVPGNVLTGNANGTGTVWRDINDLVRPFLQFKQQRIKYKGYVWIEFAGDMIVNPLLQNIIQVGDIVEGWVTDGDPEDNTSSWYVMSSGRYKAGSGDKRVLSSYECAKIEFMAFPEDPDYNKELNLT